MGEVSRGTADRKISALILLFASLKLRRRRGTTVQSPLVWSANSDWKLDYCNIARLSLEEIKQRRVKFERQKNVARSKREEASAFAGSEVPAQPSNSFA